MILNRANDYCKNEKERLREQARDKYRNLSKEEKNEKQKYGTKIYHNMSEKIKEYQKIFCAAKKLKAKL